ncbi:hypothetical protein ACFVGN_09430 [Streptomyces sp. NPDC057757]|uniref:hypothetical protein n=1 Tax=Streptomyces sp. NPDC057757 TaxID=3346241 RepID=UPI003684516D
MPVEDPEEHFEDRIGVALRQAGGSYDTDRSALAAAGEVRGRRLLHRRRAVVVGSVAGVALAGLGGALFVPTDGGEREDGRRSVAASARTSPDTSPGTWPETGPISGDELVAVLQSLLPEGEFSGQESRGTDEMLPPFAHVVYDDGGGGAAVALSLAQVTPGGSAAQDATACPDKALVPYDSCVTSELSDGSALRLFQGYEYPDRRVDTKLWSADLVTPQGQHVGVQEWNAPAEKGEPVSRDEPPLTTAQLQDLVTDGQWRTAADRIGAEPGKPTVSPGTPVVGIDGEEILSTLTSLLPEGVEVVSTGGQETEYAYVVVDDEKGKSMVQINVQNDMSDVEDELFGADARTLPDGTKVVTREGPGEKSGSGVVMRTADTIRTDGRRVVVSAFNTGGLKDDATREAPALTLGQLEGIATDGSWLTID